MSRGLKPVNIENATIGFKNFSGKEGPYNRKGERSFAVFLDQGTAETMAAEGWNVKFPNRTQEDRVDPDENTRDPYVQVSVTFDNFPPNVFLISNGAPTRIGADEVGMLDWAEITNIDLVLRPYEWTVNGNSGIKAYLKSGYFSIITDPFAGKYGL